MISHKLIPSELRSTFKSIRELLKGADGIIFQAMANIAPDMDIDFIPPLNDQEIPKKYKEISDRFVDSGAKMLRGSIVLKTLLEEVLSVISDESIPGITREDILSVISFTIKDNVKLCISEELIWYLLFDLKIEKIPIYIEKESQTVVPDRILQYLSSAISSYMQHDYLAVGALLLIAFEGTLRDILSSAGYGYHGMDRPYDIYEISEAYVGQDDDKYTFRFSDDMPKPLSDFKTNLNGNTEIPIRVRRTAKERKREITYDLTIINPEGLIDYWSTDKVVQEKKHSIGGLRKALQIARADQLITVHDIPKDIDAKVLAIRNHLIHSSEDSLAEEVPNHGTLSEFLGDQELVLDFLSYIVSFINARFNS